MEAPRAAPPMVYRIEGLVVVLPRRIEDVNSLLVSPPEDSLAELYHENSKLRKTNARDFGTYVSSFARLPYLIEKMSHPYKTYPTAPQLSLPRNESCRQRIQYLLSRR
jgi:hypothetical protein